MMVKPGYEELANEYYDERHITSRNFEAATAGWLSTRDCHLPESGLVLEVGCGRGSTRRYSGIEPNRVVQTDVSFSMLALSPREPSRFRVACDASLLPFPDRVFAIVLAFLFDPFNQAAFLSESARVLEEGGIFLGTLPHDVWGRELRRLRGTDANVARFVLRNGLRIDKASYLLSGAEVTKNFSVAGFEGIESHDATLPRTVEVVSPDIVDPARSMGLDVHELPIVRFVRARKRS